MNKWDEQLRGHAIFTTLADLSEKLKDDSLISEDINVIELVDKITQLQTYAEISLRNVVPELINLGVLNNANSQMTNVRNEVNNYISNKNIAHLNNAASHVDATMAQIVLLPVPRPHIADEVFSESLSKFKSLIQNSFQELKEAKDELAITISSVSSKSDSQSQSLSELSKKIEQQSESIENHIASFNDRFDAYETNSGEKLDEKIEEYRGQVKQLLEAQKSAFSEQLDNQKSDGAGVIEALELNKQQASDLVQIIGNIGITGNYQNIANQEKAAADKWRNIALFLMIGMVGVIALTIGISATNGFDWKLALFRIGAALVLAIPATYAARESSKHRVLENINRKAELELASLDPFLEKLPEETRFKVKEELTSKFFGSSTADIKDDEPVTHSALLELLKVAISKK